MLDTKENMIQRAGDLVGNTSTSIRTKAQEWLHSRYDRIVKVVGPFTMVRQKTYSPTASTRERSLGSDVLRILNIYDQTNGYNLKEQTLDYIERRGFDTTTNTGNPLEYADIGEFNVSVELSTADTINIVSSSSSDATTEVIRVTGLVSSVETSETLICNGTSAVTSTNTWDASQKLKIAAGTADGTTLSLTGNITVTESTSGTTIAVIPASMVSPIYKWISYYPVPGSGSQPTHRVTYMKRPVRLINNNDTPDFDCCDALVEGLVADMLKEDGQDQLAFQYEASFNNKVSELLDHFRSRPNLTEQFSPSPIGNSYTLDQRIGGVYTNPWSY